MSDLDFSGAMSERQKRAAREMACGASWSVVRVESAGCAVVDIERGGGVAERYAIAPDGRDALFLGAV